MRTPAQRQALAWSAVAQVGVFCAAAWTDQTDAVLFTVFAIFAVTVGTMFLGRCQ